MYMNLMSCLDTGMILFNRYFKDRKKEFKFFLNLFFYHHNFIRRTLIYLGLEFLLQNNILKKQVF